MPLVYYSNRMETITNEMSASHLLFTFFKIELTAGPLFVLALKLRNIDQKRTNYETGFLTIHQFLYGSLKYSINFIDFPFKIDESILGLIYSFQYALTNSKYLLMSGIVFPGNEIKVVTKEITETAQGMHLAVLDEIIEFEESNIMLKLIK